MLCKLIHAWAAANRRMKKIKSRDALDKSDGIDTRHCRWHSDEKSNEAYRFSTTCYVAPRWAGSVLTCIGLTHFWVGLSILGISRSVWIPFPLDLLHRRYEDWHYPFKLNCSVWHLLCTWKFPNIWYTIRVQARSEEVLLSLICLFSFCILTVSLMSGSLKSRTCSQLYLRLYYNDRLTSWSTGFGVMIRTHKSRLGAPVSCQ